MKHIELDCRGLQCPEPVARCRAAITENGQSSLTVIVDNAAALENVSRFLGRQGYNVSSGQSGENEWRIKAVRNGQMPAMQEEPASQTDSGKTLVLLVTETLGRGDDELGAKLMATFLANLSELGNSLWRIVMLNGAVKLASENEEAVKHLKSLEAAGVSVLVCGTCLMHYGLLDKKQVGETTNMMDVVSSMALASKVIRP